MLSEEIETYSIHLYYPLVFHFIVFCGIFVLPFGKLSEE